MVAQLLVFVSCILLASTGGTVDVRCVPESLAGETLDEFLGIVKKESVVYNCGFLPPPAHPT